MLLIFAVLVRIVASPLSNVFQKQLTQRGADPLFTIATTYGSLTLIGVGFGLPFRFESLSAAFWQSILVVGLFGAIGNVLLVKALQIGDLSVLGPINAYKSVVGLVVSFFLLHEMPNWWGLVGVICIVMGSYVVLQTDQKDKSMPHRRFSLAVFQRPEVRLRLAALLFSAIDGAFLKKAIVLSTPVTAFFYWSLFGFAFSLIWMLVVARKALGEQIHVMTSQKFIYFRLVMMIALTQVAGNVVLEEVQVGYALALFQTSALLSVLFGYRFFQEREIIRKLVGASLMVAGAVLIILLR